MSTAFWGILRRFNTKEAVKARKIAGMAVDRSLTSRQAEA
jgi:hypothetical protein